jgi:protein-disulfide isomerase
MLSNKTDTSENNQVGIANVNSQNTNRAPTVSGTPAVVTDSDHIRGNKDAKVVMIEYSDIQCPFCQKHHATMKKIIDEFGDQVAWVYRHLPLSQLHPLANKAALASECASEQGKFWEYIDKLFENQNTISDDYFGQLASELSLNTSQFNGCLSTSKYQSKVTAQMNDANQAGARGTPATFVNGELIPGAVPYEQFKGFIENALNQ